MKARQAILVALAAAVTFTSVAAAAPDAAKQRVAITMKDLPNGTFVLDPLQTGALKRDSGTTSVVWKDPNVVMREGQRVEIYHSTVTLEGKRGSLTIRERSEWVAVSNKNAPGFDYPPNVAIGTWKVVRGTGQYAQVTGGGRTAHAGLGAEWFAREEGFLTPS